MHTRRTTRFLIAAMVAGASAACGSTTHDAAHTTTSRPAPPTSDAFRGTGPATGSAVEVGVTELTAAAAGASRTGLGSFDQGDPAGQVNAIVTYLNAHGGLAGHRINVVVAPVDATTNANYDTIYQSICDKWTQDHHVIAGIVFRPLSSGVLPSCMNTRGAGLLAVGQGNISLADLARWPMLSTPIWLSMDRAYRTLIDRARARGWFGADPKIGLLRFDTPDMALVANHVIKPELKRFGLTVTDEATFSQPQSTADLGAITSQMQNAALRFKTQGVDHIIVEDFASLIAYEFGATAQAAKYRPARGYALTSDSLPAFTVQNLQGGAAQFAGSVGVGWSPSQTAVDVNAAQNPNLDNPGARRCLSVMHSGGQKMSSDTVRQNAFVYCDLFFALQAAVNRSGHATAQGYEAGIDSLGSAFQPALTFATAFTASRHDGPAYVRDLTLDPGCSCWTYIGGNHPA